MLLGAIVPLSVDKQTVSKKISSINIGTIWTPVKTYASNTWTQVNTGCKNTWTQVNTNAKNKWKSAGP